MKGILEELKIQKTNFGVCSGEWIKNPVGEELVSINPATGEEIARVLKAVPESYEEVVLAAQESFKSWRMLPAPKRGEIVRQIGEELRIYK